MINFGVQAFCKEYLIEHFNKNFFRQPYGKVESQVTEFLTNCLPGADVKRTADKLMELHDLGYLPISLRTIPEGGKVELGCPNIEIVTTKEGFQWIGGFIESLISSYIWKPMIDATVGHWYREVANEYYKKTADDWMTKARSAMSEFGFRGADSPESGIHSGAGWLLSFDKTATCASIPWINKMYNVRYPGKLEAVDSYYEKYLTLKNLSHSQSNLEDFMDECYRYAIDLANDKITENELPEYSEFIKNFKEDTGGEYTYKEEIILCDGSTKKIDIKEWRSKSVDVAKYFEKYKNDSLDDFMNDNESWHSRQSYDEVTEKYKTELPYGYDRYPDWLIPDEIYEIENKLINGKLIVNDGKNKYHLQNVDECIVGKGLISTEHSVMCSSTALNIRRMKSRVINITKYYEIYKKSTGSNDKVEFLDSIRNMYLDPQVEHTEWVLPENIWMNRWFEIEGQIFKYSVTNDKFWEATEDKLQEVAETKVVMKLLTEIYPDSSFSMVSDSYDYWRLVTKILPILKNEVINHNGTLFVRGDSGDPVKIVAGYVNASPILAINGVKTDTHEMDDQILVRILKLDEDFRPKLIELKELAEKGYVTYYHNGKLHQIRWINICSDDAEFYACETDMPECELKGTVKCLWDTFGGTVNSKGYKVLYNHVRAIYGDSITQERQKLIYQILELKGFSVENVALGAGSFSFHCYQDKNGQLYPYTRDTYNFAQKATYGEYESHHVGSSADGSGGLQTYTGVDPLMIYKDPKTDSDHFKKSMKGCCAVYTTETDVDGNFTYYLSHDELTLQERESDSNNRLVEIFRDGIMTHEWTFSEIRDELNLGKF